MCVRRKRRKEKEKERKKKRIFLKEGTSITNKKKSSLFFDQHNSTNQNGFISTVTQLHAV